MGHSLRLFRLARRVKINEINRLSSFLPIRYFALLLKALQSIVFKYYSNFSLIFMQDSGSKPIFSMQTQARTKTGVITETRINTWILHESEGEN